MNTLFGRGAGSCHSVNVSTLGLEGPQMGKLVGWLMDKIEGEEKESAWSVDLGVTMGELTYQDHGLRRVVVLWRDGVTALRAERLGVNFGIGWGSCFRPTILPRGSKAAWRGSTRSCW